jgi:hypothetical protein
MNLFYKGLALHEIETLSNYSYHKECINTTLDV